MDGTGERDGIGLNQAEPGPQGKSLRIRVGGPGKQLLHGKGVPTGTRSPRILKQEEEKLILDGSIRRGQRIAARLADNDEFPLCADRWGMSKLQESLPAPSFPARIAKLRAQRLLFRGVSPQASRAPVRVVPDSEPDAGSPSREHRKLAVLDSVELKACMEHPDSCLSEDAPATDFPLRLRVLSAPQSGNNSPATSLRTPSRRRVRWWDEVVGKENERCRNDQHSFSSKPACPAPKHALSKVQKDGRGSIQELGRRPLQLQSD